MWGGSSSQSKPTIIATGSSIVNDQYYALTPSPIISPDSNNNNYYAVGSPTTVASSSNSNGAASNTERRILNDSDYREITFEELKMDDIPIGSGAFGVVHKGTWRGATVAIKKLLVVMDDDQLREEIRREASVIQRVANHPNIVRFYGACTKKTPYCLVMTLYPRGSVLGLLKSKTHLEWRTKVGFARDAAAGILHLHCENVIHRDIAARNLLVDDQWAVRITDFGLARIKVSATGNTKSNVGPVKWMAPEALKQKQYSVKSDSYSFGILMWELLTRKEPYEEMDTIQVALSVIDGHRPLIPEGTPSEYANLMASCWNPDPDQRPDFFKILEVLENYYESLPPVPDPVLTNSVLGTFSLGSPPSSQILSASAAKMNRDLECPICGDIFDTVVETPCCHACYCYRCIPGWGSKSGTCPDCRAVLVATNLKPNVPLQRLVDNIPAECPNSLLGCADKITRGIVSEHLRRCDYSVVDCGGYAQTIAEGLNIPNDVEACDKVTRKALADHKKHDCPFRIVGCPQGCDADLRYCLLEAHQTVCPEMIVVCPNGCGTEVKRAELQSHCDTDCVLQSVACKYSKWGCTEVLVRRDESRHYDGNSAMHLQLAENYINGKESELTTHSDGLVQRCAVLQQENTQLRLTVEELSSLKPLLPHHPLSHLPLVLPYCLSLPTTNTDAMSLLALDSDQRTIAYQQAPQKFFSKAVPGINKAVIIRSDKPIPIASEIYYFEVSVKSLGKDGAVGIGLVAPNTDILAMPGWFAHTYGFHGDDGRKFGAPNHRYGMPYGPTWNKDDVVGCGWDQHNQKLFFTLNGKFLGVAFENVMGTYFVAVGLHTPGARIKVNFGQEPFLFNTQNFVVPNFIAASSSSA